MGGDEIGAFLRKWGPSGGAERANYQLFLLDLAGLIGAPPVEPTEQGEAANNYVFEKAVRFKHADGTETSGYIDLYKRGCFVCEAKQRAEEEKRGPVRWLRPDFQNPTGATAAPITDTQTELDVEEAEQKPVFPEPIGERARAVRHVLVTLGKPATPREVWQSFRNGGSYSKSVKELLETMTALGQAVEHEGRYFAA